MDIFIIDLVVSFQGDRPVFFIYIIILSIGDFLKPELLLPEQILGIIVAPLLNYSYELAPDWNCGVAERRQKHLV